MNLENIMMLTTIVVCLILGQLAKKYIWISNRLIPLQNLFIGIISSVIYYFITKDFNMTITLTGLTAGGTYDIIKNLLEITRKEVKNE